MKKTIKPVDVKDKTSPIIACPSKISTVLSKGVCMDTIPILGSIVAPSISVVMIEAPP